jgi:hypothetical protein
VYSPAEVEHALGLLDTGLNVSQASRQTGISRAAITSWSRGQTPGRPGTRSRHLRDGCFRCATLDGRPGIDPFPGLTRFAYAYLLGLYLGDGYLATFPRRVYRLGIYLDRAYPVIVREAGAAMSLCMPLNSVTVSPQRGHNTDAVLSYSQHWPCLFPQHGPGAKHLRPIRLDSWQRRIVDEHPWRFLRGLIHSDGCRSMNPSIHPHKTYWYSRYSFCNHSFDIQRLFCEYCEKVGVQWRQMNRWNISVARRGSVAAMDRHIGPKR